MKKYARSLDVLIREFPDKKASEILEIYNDDIAEYIKYCENLNKKILTTSKWLKDDKFFKIKYAGTTDVNYIEILDCIEHSSGTDLDISVIHNSTYLSKFNNLNINKKLNKTTMLENLYSSCDEIIAISEKEYLNFQSKIEELFL